ncbi:MAG: GNAT family N-acetyltransferase [Protaetiibacter sp.]
MTASVIVDYRDSLAAALVPCPERPNRKNAMNRPDFTIRRATTGDADSVLNLVRQFAVSFTPSQERFSEAFAAALDRDDLFAAVAVDAPNVVGYVLANRHITFFADGPVVWVEEVMVDPASRKHGIGRALMDATEAWARAEGARYISLATRRASDFYRAIGYEDSAVFFRKLLD